VIATLLAVLTRNYRRAGPVGRRQVKWVVTGVYLGTAPVLAAVVAAAIDPGLQWLWDWSLVALLLIPVFTFIAITRSNLLDIDRVISGAASYSLLVVLLALGEEVLFEPLAGRGASSLLGVDPFTGQVVFVGLLAAVLVPAERVWRPYLDRIFFAEGRSLEARVEKILEELFQTTDGETVIQRTAAGIERTFHPEFCAIYKRAGEVFEPAYVVGSGEFPAILADSRAIRTLETKVVPIRLDPRALTPGSADRGALPESGAALIVPLRPGGAPDAFVGIGPKRSGDVYTSTDLSLLSAVAHAASTRLAGGIPDRDMKE
jgi:hypothetical protein